MNRLNILFFVFLFSTFFLSCQKEDTIETKDPLKITLKNTDEYFYDFNISGDEEGTTIKTQATHFTTSEIIRNESTNWSAVYHYIPESGFVGKDSVEIETNTCSDGTGNGKIEIVKFSFQITE